MEHKRIRGCPGESAAGKEDANQVNYRKLDEITDPNVSVTDRKREVQ